MDDPTSAVKSYILHEFMPGRSPSDLTDSLPLISSGILDSIATMQLVTFLEDSFDIEIKAHEIDRTYLDTVSSIRSFIESKRQR